MQSRYNIGMSTSTVGFAVADECHVMLAACPEFAKLITLAKGEA